MFVVFPHFLLKGEHILGGKYGAYGGYDVILLKTRKKIDLKLKVIK